MCIYTYANDILSHTYFLYIYNLALWQQLMVTNADGYVATEDADNLLCGCTKTAAVFNYDWMNKVIADTGDHYKLPTDCDGYIDPVCINMIAAIYTHTHYIMFHFVIVVVVVVVFVII